MSGLLTTFRNRGAFIVLEGCDKCGKTTQSKLIVKYLNEKGFEAKYMNFPARNSQSGELINSYLKNKKDLPDECIHLLFTANRWEAKEEIQKLLMQGISLIVDRYSYSGVAFSAAKGLSYEWCKAPEVGLLKPDLVIYLKTPLNELSGRSEFGAERYEKLEFQRRVELIYDRLYKEENKYWLEVDASRNIEELQEYLSLRILDLIKEVKNKPLELLWREPNVL